MRKYLVSALALATLTLVSACGTSGGDDDAAAEKTTTTADASETTEAPEEETTTTEASDALTVEDWAADFCGNFNGWLDDIEAASGDVGEQVTPGDYESAKTAIAGLFGTASSITQDLITSLEEGGYPDIDDGDQLVEDLISKFQDFDVAATDAQSDAEALDTSDATAFAADAEELTTRFQDEVSIVGDSFAEIDTNYPSPELTDAVSASCGF